MHPKAIQFVQSEEILTSERLVNIMFFIIVLSFSRSRQIALLSYRESNALLITLHYLSVSSRLQLTLFFVGANKLLYFSIMQTIFQFIHVTITFMQTSCVKVTLVNYFH